MSYQFGVNQMQNTTVPNAKYKTMLCRHYQATKQCAIGAKCQFAHGIEEQRQMNDPLPASALSAITTTIEQPTKPQQPVFKIPCKYHALSYCKNGAGCQYMHDEPQQQQQQQYIDPMQLTLSHILVEMQMIFQSDDIIQKLKVANDQVRAGNLVFGSECIRNIINSPERTQEEISQYTLLYNSSVAYYNQLQQQ